ncbi:uncharacterized protein LOC109428145 [Aedes albopictus]|uniref:Secreted protein n=1 Tax=Aedes albopictus TaxID=7160 RepID=A0ABM1Z8C7_AEDAL
MKFRECNVVLIFFLMVLIWSESALGQTTEPEYEYEYYYDDETTVASVSATPATTTTTTTTTTTRRPTTTKRNGNLISTTRRRMSQKYQYMRPDVVVNIISDMYGLSGMQVNGRQLGFGSQRYLGSSGYRRYSNRYSSRYGRPIDYWYTLRSDPYVSTQQRRQRGMTDYSGDYYSDDNDYYYDLLSSSPRNRADAQRRGSNRAIYNFMLSALNRRRN